MKRDCALTGGRLTVILSIALLLIQGASCTRSAQGVEPAPEVIDLNSLEPLKQAFERDQGKVRLIALLSPV
ncbi:MAG TPA: hypothetical protein VJ810_37735 [Blastocatellia bacterium]|nr:hypothetical protein [Blastocatellia bacterium]